MVLEVLDRAVENTVGVLDDSFDLPRLDALTVDLYHPVLAVEIDKISVLALFADVAGSKQFFEAIPFNKGIVYKGLFCQLWQIQIARGKMTRKAHLAFVGFLIVFIQKVSPDISDGPAYRGVVVFFVDAEHHYRAG